MARDYYQDHNNGRGPLKGHNLRWRWLSPHWQFTGFVPIARCLKTESEPLLGPDDQTMYLVYHVEDRALTMKNHVNKDLSMWRK